MSKDEKCEQCGNLTVNCSCIIAKDGPFVLQVSNPEHKPDVTGDEDNPFFEGNPWEENT